MSKQNARRRSLTQREFSAELTDAQKRALTKRVLALLQKDIERMNERQGGARR